MMKKIILFLIGIMLTLPIFSQKIEYPKYDIDSNGQQIVLMTIEQVQKLDNATDLVKLLEELNVNIGSYDSICIQAINDKEQVISSQKIEINILKNIIKNGNEQITSLQNQIIAYEKKVKITEEQLLITNQIVNEKDKQIKKLKAKMIVGGVSGGAAIIALILVIIL